MAPTAAEGLKVESSKDEMNVAVSSCISQLIKENPTMKNDQAVAICMSMARKAMGHGSSKAE